MFFSSWLWPLTAFPWSCQLSWWTSKRGATRNSAQMFHTGSSGCATWLLAGSSWRSTHGKNLPITTWKTCRLTKQPVPLNVRGRRAVFLTWRQRQTTKKPKMLPVQQSYFPSTEVNRAPARIHITTSLEKRTKRPPSALLHIVRSGSYRGHCREQAVLLTKILTPDSASRVCVSTRCRWSVSGSTWRKWWTSSPSSSISFPWRFRWRWSSLSYLFTVRRKWTRSNSHAKTVIQAVKTKKSLPHNVNCLSSQLQTLMKITYSVWKTIHAHTQLKTISHIILYTLIYILNFHSLPWQWARWVLHKY